jgi:hypothetical protein
MTFERQHNRWRLSLAVALAVSAAALTTGASAGAAGLSTFTVEPTIVPARDCQTNAATRAGQGITTVISVANRIYINPDRSTETKNQLSALYKEKVPKVINAANALLARLGANLQVTSQRTNNVFYKPMAKPAVSSNVGPTDSNLGYVTRVGTREPSLIQIHWSTEGATTKPVGYAGAMRVRLHLERTNWVGITYSDFRTKDVATIGKTLAHELGHYFSLEHVIDRTNLMVDSEPNGENLTASQRVAFWDGIDARTHLRTVSCAPRSGPLGGVSGASVASSLG